MQSTIASRCLRARKLIVHKGEMTMMNPRLLGGINSSSHIFTRQISTRRNPWELSRATPFFFKHLNAFVSDFPPQKPGSVPNGFALLSTTTGSDVNGTKNAPISKGKASQEQINNTKILTTLAKSLWMEDNFEFRLRVITALGFLIGAKVLNVQVPFLFKLAVDWLTATGNSSGIAAFATANSTAVVVFASPAAVLIGYGIARTGASAFNGTSYES